MEHERRRRKQVRRKKGETGQALALFVVCLATVLIGGVGVAIDGSMLYTEHHRAQTAADSGAQAGAMDLYYSNSTSTGYPSWSSGAFTCSGSNATAPPCQYVAMNGFGTVNDSTAVDFPSTVSGVTTCTTSTPTGTPCGWNYIRVQVTRHVPMTFLRVVGFSTTDVVATAIAGLTQAPSQVPIVVTHPHLADSFSTNGSVTLTICGGPSRSIEVDSDGTQAQAGGGGVKTVSPPEASVMTGGTNKVVVDLSHAGPGDDGFCHTGTGADFGSLGAVATQNASLNWLNPGTTGHYVQPSIPINDPLASLTEPAQPATVQSTPATIAPGASLGIPNCSAVCPATNGGCQVYHPGTYQGGISVSGNKNFTAYFYPGLYYIVDVSASNKNVGFTGGPNSDMEMASSVCSSVPADPGSSSIPSTSSGMVVFNAGSSTFTVGANGAANLTGAPNTSSYEGVLLWEKRSLSGNPKTPHKIGGGGALTLIGTIYINQAAPTISNYQSVLLQGNSGSNTNIQGEIITNALSLGGNSSITMNLSPYRLLNQVKVALVQ